MRRTLYKQVKCCYNVIIGIVLNTIYASIDIQSVSHLLSYSPKYGAYASLSGLDSLIKGNNFGKTKLVFFRFFISFLVVQLVVVETFHLFIIYILSQCCMLKNSQVINVNIYMVEQLSF
jgi:succinate-acetate transporter protein